MLAEEGIHSLAHGLEYVVATPWGELLVFDDITSGASSDIERVTRLARMMVTRLGMSGEMGPMVYGQKEELIFLGREISEQRDYSEAVAEQIDREVRKIVDEHGGRVEADLPGGVDQPVDAGQIGVTIGLV